MSRGQASSGRGCSLISMSTYSRFSLDSACVSLDDMLHAGTLIAFQIPRSFELLLDPYNSMMQ